MFTACFQIFGQCPPRPHSHVPETAPVHHDATAINVYTDGSCKNNGDEDALAGAGVWYAPNDARNLALKIPPDLKQSNNTGELIAILAAVQQANTKETLTIHTDSQYSIACMSCPGTSMEKKGWIGTANKEIIRALLAHLRERRGNTYVVKVKGHSGNMGNDGADHLANEGSDKNTPNIVDLSIPEYLQIEGAEFASLTQAMLYKGIHKLKIKKLALRRKTTANLNIIQWAAKNRWQHTPTDKLIWASIRHADIDCNIRAFL